MLADASYTGTTPRLLLATPSGAAVIAVVDLGVKRLAPPTEPLDPAPVLKSAVESDDAYTVVATFDVDTDTAGMGVGLANAGSCATVFNAASVALFGKASPGVDTDATATPASFTITEPMPGGPVCAWSSARVLVVLQGVNAVGVDGDALVLRSAAVRAADGESEYASGSVLLQARQPAPDLLAAVFDASGARLTLKFSGGSRDKLQKLGTACSAYVCRACRLWQCWARCSVCSRSRHVPHWCCAMMVSQRTGTLNTQPCWASGPPASVLLCAPLLPLTLPAPPRPHSLLNASVWCRPACRAC